MGNTAYKYSLFMILCIAIMSVMLGASWGTGGTAYGGSNFSFSIDPLVGALGIIIIITIIGTIFGLKLFGSGLSDESVRTIIIGLGYTGLWTTFSVISSPFLSAIPIFGTLFYVILTILYVIGVYNKIAGGND